MSLPREEWIDQAKRAPIGGTIRVRHNREHSAAMVVGNDHDRYWSFCQRCKQGGVHMKTHVPFVKAAPKDSASLVLPNDCTQVHSCKDTQQLIEGFLATKNMSLTYTGTDNLYYSASRQRLLIRDIMGKIVGRDLTGKSTAKWLTYSNQTFQRFIWAPVHEHPQVVLITEDTFSMHKVQWALDRSDIYAHVYCSLGTRISSELKLLLLNLKAPVLMFYDGDAAGHSGAREGVKSLAALGLKAKGACAPAGFDPKDMHVTDITNHVKGHLTDG